MSKSSSLETAAIVKKLKDDKKIKKKKIISKKRSAAKIFLNQVGGLLPNLTLHSILNITIDFPQQEDRQLREEEFGLIIDPHEGAILRAISGVVCSSGYDLWFKTETLPTGWGDFLIIQHKAANNQAKRIYERKTVPDLKSSIADKNRHKQFKMFCGTAEQENILATIILEVTTTDRFLRPPQFSADLKEYRPDGKITCYNCRAFLNSLPCRYHITSGVMETAVYLLKEINILLNLENITKVETSSKKPKCLQPVNDAEC